MIVEIDIPMDCKWELMLGEKINKLVADTFKSDTQIHNATDKWVIQEN